MVDGDISLPQLVPIVVFVKLMMVSTLTVTLCIQTLDWMLYKVNKNWFLHTRHGPDINRGAACEGCSATHNMKVLGQWVGQGWARQIMYVLCIVLISDEHFVPIVVIDSC